jgi:pyruvate carboxylase
LLIFIAKNYIYKCKLKEKIPNIIEMKYRIKNYYSLEQYIAIKNNNLKDLEKYWTPVKHVFQAFKTVIESPQERKYQRTIKK